MLYPILWIMLSEPAPFLLDPLIQKPSGTTHKIHNHNCWYPPPSSQPDRALSALSYGLKPSCNLSQLRNERTSIACAHTTGSSNNHISQVSYRNLLRSQYKQGCNQCYHSHKQVYHNMNTHQLHLNETYKHISAIVSTLPVERTI
jgi:hypothetical protein